MGSFIDDSGEEEFEDASSSEVDVPLSDDSAANAKPTKAKAGKKGDAGAAAAKGAAVAATKGRTDPASPAPTSASKGKGKAKAAASADKTTAATPAKSPKTPAKPKAQSATKRSASKSSASSSGAQSGGGAPTDPNIAVLRYMRQVNRPYSVINIHDNLHKKVPKALVQKIVDQLAADGQLSAQEYGKSKVYYMNQKKLEEEMGDVSTHSLARLAAEAKEVTAELATAEAAAREANARAAALAAYPADDELDAGLSAAEAAAVALSGRLAGVKRALADAGAEAARPDALKRARKEFNSVRAMWSERRQNVMSLVDEMASDGSSRPGELCEKLGIEGDSGKIPERMKVD